MASSTASPLSATSPTKRPPKRAAFEQTLAYPSPARSEPDRLVSSAEGLGLFNVPVAFSSSEVWADASFCPQSPRAPEGWIHPLTSGSAPFGSELLANIWTETTNPVSSEAQATFQWSPVPCLTMAESFTGRLSPAASDPLVSAGSTVSSHGLHINTRNEHDVVRSKVEQDQHLDWLSHSTSREGFDYQTPTVCPDHLSSASSISYLADYHTPAPSRPTPATDEATDVETVSRFFTESARQSSVEPNDGTSKDITRVRGVRRPTTKDNAKYECNVCNKLFRTRYNHQTHMLIHNPSREYPHACEYDRCTKRFVRKTDLIRHEQAVRNPHRH